MSSVDAQTNRQWILFVDMECLQKCGLGLLRLVQQNGISCLSLIQIRLFNTHSSWSGCQQKSVYFISSEKIRAHSQKYILRQRWMSRKSLEPSNVNGMYMTHGAFASFIYHMSMFSTWIVNVSEFLFFLRMHSCDDASHSNSIRFNDYVEQFDVFVVRVAISIQRRSGIVVPPNK